MLKITSEDKHIGEKLKSYRLATGVSQQELAKTSNITFQQVQKYEKGIDRISSGTLYRFACCLNIPVSYFFDGLDKEITKTESNKSLESLTYGSKELALVNFYKKIKDSNLRNKILNLVQILSSE